MADVDEDLPPWAAHEAPTDERPRRSRPWLLVIAGLPWLVVLGLVAAGTVPGSTPDPAGTPAGAPAAGEAAEPVEDASAAGDASDPADADAPPSSGRTGWPEAPEGEDLTRPAATGGPPDDAAGATGPVAAVALVVARAWLTDVGPAIEVDGLEPHTDRYLEHAVVEHVDEHGDHAVVRLLAVVLVRDGERYDRVETRRLAVPMALDDPPRPAGAPWWLEEVDLAITSPEPLTEVDGAEELLSLSEALVAAGFDEPEVVGASRTGDGWWLARLAAAGPSDVAGAVWLRPGPQGPVVAGARRGPEPTPDAEEEP